MGGVMDLAWLYKCVQTEVTVCLVFTPNGRKGRKKTQTIQSVTFSAAFLLCFLYTPYSIVKSVEISSSIQWNNINL